MTHATPFATVRALVALILLLLAATLMACSQKAEGSTATPARHAVNVELVRTSHGVVHVRADGFNALGYGIAYAYAEDNLCMFADSLLTVKGERSRFFGGEGYATRRVGDEYGAASDFIHLRNEDSDFFFKGYLDLAELKAGYMAASQEARELLAGYAAGYNRYLKDHEGHFPAACNKAAWVRPITAEDMYLVIAEKALHASGEVFAAEIVAGAVDNATRPESASGTGRRLADTSFMRTRLDALTEGKLGSNALALGKEVTDSGRGILLGNPHYPWTSTDRFYQMHLTVPGRYDAMGVILGGIPLVVIGFNHDVAWTHTVTTAVHFTTFRLKLDPADATRTTYFMDGKPVKMHTREVTVDVLQPDGKHALKSKTFYFSKQGAVMVKPDAGMAWTANAVTVLADPNRNNTRMVDQWIGIGSARSVHELKASLDKTVGLPWVNTIAADRRGDTLYADASVVPRMSADKFKPDCLLAPQLLTFDGSRSRCGWGKDAGVPDGVLAPESGPWMIRSDYVGNSNDSFWLTNARALLTGPAPYGFSPLYGKIGVEQKLRTRVGFRQLEDELAQHRRFKLEDVQRLAFANRVHAAELVLPPLLEACRAQRDRTIVGGCKALAGWDRRAELDSRGTVLFREFWNVASKIPNKWGKPFDPADPVNTPSGLSSAAMPAMLVALKQAALKLQGMKIPLDARLGDLQGETRNGVRVPVHGAIGDIDGSYNSIHMAGDLNAAGYNNVAWGTSYVQAVTFDDAGPVAHAMLVYGQSTDPKSPWYADQLRLFSEKQWPALPFSPASIKRDPHYSLRVLSE